MAKLLLSGGTALLGAVLGSALTWSAIPGTAWADTVTCAPSSLCVGSDGDDRLLGAGGGEDLRGRAGHDALLGNAGFDYLDGGSGVDVLRGGSGGDTYVFRAGWQADGVTDLSGFDSLDFSLLQIPVSVDLVPRSGRANAVAGDNRVFVSSGTVVEQAVGGLGDDLLVGNPADNSMDGGFGDDVLRGGRGDDGLGGNRGDDRVTGGPGQDVVTTRAGDDVVYLVDGEADEVSCGDGADTVFFDQGLDAVSGTCDNLVPRPSPPTGR